MHQYRKEHRIARMAQVLQVSESGYYKWLRKQTAEPTQRELENIRLKEEILTCFKGHYGIFGSRKIHVIINKDREEPVNHKRVERIMRENMLFAKTAKRYIQTTDSSHSDPVAENLLNRNFTTLSPNEKFVSDTTVIPTVQGDVYAAAILDLCGRIPVGLSMGPIMIAF